MEIASRPSATNLLRRPEKGVAFNYRLDGSAWTGAHLLPFCAAKPITRFDLGAKV